MRTTLDIDDELMAAAQSRFPPGTPKTVVIEEGLRRLAAAPLGAPVRRRDPRIQRLIDEGLLTPATASGPLPERTGDIPLEDLLRDLAADREDR